MRTDAVGLCVSRASMRTLFARDTHARPPSWVDVRPPTRGVGMLLYLRCRRNPFHLCPTARGCGRWVARRRPCGRLLRPALPWGARGTGSPILGPAIDLARRGVSCFLFPASFTRTTLRGFPLLDAGRTLSASTMSSERVCHSSRAEVARPHCIATPSALRCPAQQKCTTYSERDVCSAS